jgi:hypothetical protein
MNNQSMTRMNGMSPRSSIDMKGKKAVNRMAALKGEVTRPDTPSLWSSAYMQHGQDFLGDSVPEENYNDVFNDSTVGNDTTLLGSGDNTGYKESESESDRTNDSDVSYDSYNDGYKEDDEKEEEDGEEEEEEEEEEDDDELDARDNFYDKKVSPNQTNNNGTHIQDWSALTGENGFSNMALGGWGGDSPFQNSSKATQNETPDGLTTKRKSQLDESYPDQSNTDYIQQWRESSTNGVPQKKHSLTQNRNQYSLANNDADGWGEVDKFVPWDDLRKQGYNAKLLEQQKKTSFWQPGEQKWNTPNGEGQAELETHGSGPKEKNPVNFTSLVSQNPTNRKRSDSCVSSQSSVNLDEGADIILKTTTDGPLPHSNSQRKPEQTKSKQSVQDWNTLKEPVEREESATGGWSHLAKNSKSRFSRNQRTNGTNTRKTIPPNQMAGNWGRFQQMNQTNSTNSVNQVNQIEYTNPRALTPIRPSSSLQRTPPPRNSYTPEPLIQTQGPMSLTPEPVTLDLLIDTGDEPSHTQPLEHTPFSNNLWNNNTKDQASSLNDDLASLDMQTKSPIKELEVDFLNWSSSNSEMIPEKPLFVEPIVGTGHDTPDIEIDNFDRLISETSQTSSQKKGENGYLDDISQLMSPSPEKPLIAPLLSNNPTNVESTQNELLGSNSALPSLDGATDVSSIASSPVPDNEIFSTTISVETKKYEVQKISLDEVSNKVDL